MIAVVVVIMMIFFLFVSFLCSVKLVLILCDWMGLAIAERQLYFVFSFVISIIIKVKTVRSAFSCSTSLV